MEFLPFHTFNSGSQTVHHNELIKVLWNVPGSLFLTVLLDIGILTWLKSHKILRSCFSNRLLWRALRNHCCKILVEGKSCSSKWKPGTICDCSIVFWLSSLIKWLMIFSLSTWKSIVFLWFEAIVYIFPFPQWNGPSCERLCKKLYRRLGHCEQKVRCMFLHFLFADPWDVEEGYWFLENRFCIGFFKKNHTCYETILLYCKISFLGSCHQNSEKAAIFLEVVQLGERCSWKMDGTFYLLSYSLCVCTCACMCIYGLWRWLDAGSS